MDFTWAGPGTLGALIGSAVAVALLARIEYLNSAYRLRKRLKDEAELADKLPDSEQKSMLQAIILSDTAKYNTYRSREYSTLPMIMVTLVMLAAVLVIGLLATITDIALLRENEHVIVWFAPVTVLVAVVVIKIDYGVWKKRRREERRLMTLGAVYNQGATTHEGT